ncbi:MAG: alpha/beta fold hydrolase [Chloroflexi bacterium]|nr:alpha/beta fold hydrolase [Chloroflexota bacterium]
MEAKETEGKSLFYVTIHPDGYNPRRSYPLIILLHGFGAHMYDLAQLTPAISRTGYVYACPNAPIGLDIGGGQVGFGWTPPTGFRDPAAMQQAEDLLEVFFAEVQETYRVDANKVLLLGFSQGGSLAYRCGLTQPQTFAGVVALSTGLQDSEALTPRLPLQRTQPLFIAHGMDDPMVPVEAAQRTRQQLEQWGYRPVYHEYPMGHEITPELINDLVPWIHQVLPPLGGGLVLSG